MEHKRIAVCIEMFKIQFINNYFVLTFNEQNLKAVVHKTEQCL